MQATISMGVQQSNRSLIESTFISALGNPDLVYVALCSGPSAKISYPPGPVEYCLLESGNFHRWPIRKPLIGVQGLDLLVVLSPLTTFEPLLVLMVIMFITLVAVVLTISKLQKQFETEVLNPLRQGLNSTAPLDIYEMDELRRKNLAHIQLVQEKSVADAMIGLASQVAHDIRSPLAALDAALKNTAELPEERRVMVRLAVNRIRDIANNLLEKNRRQPGTASDDDKSDGEVLEIRLLSSLIDSVVSEKRLQFTSKPGISIDFSPAHGSYGLFANIQPVEFGRLLSNLVNNAVDALGDNGKVSVGLAHENTHIILTISDTGKGIPPEILKKLGQKGETHGKTGGSGLGLFHAKTSVKSWGGSFNITSEPGKGTVVSIELPKAEPPAYFVGELKLAPGSQVVVLDDDPGVHLIWRGRFESARTKDHNIEEYFFTKPEQLRLWVKENPDMRAKAVYLLDYELSGHNETGLSLAEELNLCDRTILVTSRSEEPQIIAECIRLGVRMIPKGLSGFVPVLAGSPAPTAAVSAVLLDDDAITHMNWEWSAKENGVELKTYTDPGSFMAGIKDLPKDIPLYIDSELGEGVKGEEIATELKEKGFTNIHLATGHPPEKFAHLPWLRVVSKEAPWGEKTSGG